MRVIFILLSALFSLMAQDIEITAQRFEASEQELVSRFLGDVVVKRGSDILKAGEAYIYFNKEKKPVKIVLQKGVFFDIRHKEKRYKGRAGKIIYYPAKKEYIFLENVQIVELPKNQKIFAQKVYLNLVKNMLKVEGEKDRPVKFILKVKE